MAITLNTTLPVFPKPIFAGNLPDLSFSGIGAANGMTFKLSNTPTGESTTLILNETIFPDSNGNATIKIRSVVESILYHQYPSSDLFSQKYAIGLLTIEYNSTAVFVRVVKGGLFIPENEFETYTYDTFILTNFLSWMPAERKVKYIEPNFLNYYVQQSVSGCQLYMRSYYIDQFGSVQSQTQAIYSVLTAGNLYSIDVSFNKLVSLISSPPENLFAFDIYVKRGSTVLTNIYRIILDAQFDESDDIFAFSNSLGGFETIRFNGALTESENHETQSYLDNSDRTIEFETTILREMKKFTGYFESEAARKWLREFFTSNLRYHLRFGQQELIPERIILTISSAESIRYMPNSFEFKFRYANQVAWQLHSRETLNEINTGEHRAPIGGDMENYMRNEDFFTDPGAQAIADAVFGTAN